MCVLYTNVYATIWSMSVIDDLQKLKNPEKENFLPRFFKTGKGEYGEGDIFWGVNVPNQRLIAKKYRDLPFVDIEKLLHNKVHECRQIALMIMKSQWHRADEEKKKWLYEFYLKNRKHINNWDLVDISAPTIVGGWLLDKPKERAILYTLVRSKNIWDRRIAILASFMFIKHKDFTDSLSLAEILLGDKHDLIHKAVGWMLREVGKMDEAALVTFLSKHYKIMPRTMLRYAIEKFPQARRRKYLTSQIA